jgi:hypothetical protein
MAPTVRTHPALLGLVIIGALASSTPLLAQEYLFEERSQPGAEVARAGSAIVIEAPGPVTCSACAFDQARDGTRLRWLVVQDSSLGVVFTEPSGVRPSADVYGLNGDVDLRAIRDVRAVEVRAVTFNVWGEYGKLLSVTRIRNQQAGDEWSYNPSWSDIGAPAHTHRISIMWVHRVMFDDESVTLANPGGLSAAWRFITGEDLGEMEEPLLGVVQS